MRKRILSTVQALNCLIRDYNDTSRYKNVSTKKQVAEPRLSNCKTQLTFSSPVKAPILIPIAHDGDIRNWVCTDEKLRSVNYRFVQVTLCVYERISKCRTIRSRQCTSNKDNFNRFVILYFVFTKRCAGEKSTALLQRVFFWSVDE
jgi:hypothetical protein